MHTLKGATLRNFESLNSYDYYLFTHLLDPSMPKAYLRFRDDCTLEDLSRMIGQLLLMECTVVRKYNQRKSARMVVGYV